jgi:APA family basic amino acid/polyamine antiporter
MDPGITAALATGLAAYLGYLVPLGAAGLKAAAVAAIVTGALINVAGARLGAGVITALAALKLGALATIVAAGFLLGRGEWSHFVPFVVRPADAVPLGGALAGAFVSAFFAFGGWWEAAKLSGEVRDPARTMPRALALGVGLVTLAYLLTSAAFLYLVPLDAVTSDEAFAALAGEALFGRAGGVALAAVVLVSVAGSLFAVQMMLPRLYYAMGRDGVFPAAFGRLHPTRGTPVRAILLQAALASALVAVGSFEAIIAYFIFVTVGFVGLTVAGSLRGFTTAPRHDGTRRVSVPISAVTFLALVSVLLVLIATNRPFQAMAGVAIVAAGLPVYAVIERRRARTQPT